MRFVVLHHRGSESQANSSHFDLMLEHNGKLLTWALPICPMSGSPSGISSARRLPDHRVHYLNYEGEIGGGRGVVQRKLAGMVEWILFDGVGRKYRARLASGGITWLLDISAPVEPASNDGISISWQKEQPG